MFRGIAASRSGLTRTNDDHSATHIDKEPRRRPVSPWQPLPLLSVGRRGVYRMTRKIVHIENVVPRRDAVVVSVDADGVVTIQRCGRSDGIVLIEACDVESVAASLARMASYSQKGFSARSHVSPMVQSELDKIADVLGVDRRNR